MQPHVAGFRIADCSQTAGKLPLPDADIVIVSAQAGRTTGDRRFAGCAIWGRSNRRAVRSAAIAAGPGAARRAGLCCRARGTARLGRGMNGFAPISMPRSLPRAAGRRAGLAADRDVAAYRMPGVSSAAQLIPARHGGVLVSAGECIVRRESMRQTMSLRRWSYTARRRRRDRRAWLRLDHHARRRRARYRQGVGDVARDVVRATHDLSRLQATRRSREALAAMFALAPDRSMPTPHSAHREAATRAAVEGEKRATRSRRCCVRWPGRVHQQRDRGATGRSRAPARSSRCRPNAPPYSTPWLRWAPGRGA